MAMALIAIYGLLNLFANPGGHLLTDVGGKAASLEAMSQRGDWNVDMGYWFEDADPDGQFYPLDKTTLTPNGKWVNTTSLTMIYPMRPLYAVGGARLAALIPMLGGLLCALAAAALERRIDTTSTGRWSFWLVGLASPVVVYTLDLWEHSLGLGMTAVGVVAVHDALNDRMPLRASALAGLMYGVAATMRQEALVYGFVAGLILVAVSISRQNVRTAASRGLAMATATIVPLAIHTIVEYIVLGGPIRLQRSTATASNGGSGTSSDQIDSALTSTINLLNGTNPMQSVLGVLFGAAVVWVTLDMMTSRRPHYSRLLLIGLFAIASIVYLSNLTPVPSLIVAAPMTIVGTVAAIRARTWILLTLGLAPLPLVLMSQFPGGEAFQWGARYALLTGLVLTVTAVGLLRREHKQLLTVFTAASIVISLYGAGWAITRINNSAEDRASIATLTDPDDVVVWRSPIVAREFGSMAIGRKWLSAELPGDQLELARVFEKQNIDSFVWIDDFTNPVTEFPGYEVTQTLGELSNFEHNVRVLRQIDTDE
jgi:hypothetical protein